ncbi:hypothetical protein JSO19_10610 [Leucobacter sp. UCMA 4100]|uniref:hypothetical protein n=1 Tax=Leucobacter sp. UCMA 4100 TaxID=2810534 RepID=UPI0022EA50A3|nr:hypothetical protein [Leucobacter sp. UCMA 4100]MDA3147828.1 hypothetical protein [Leucobacter sp. UCMA 4100]
MKKMPRFAAVTAAAAMMLTLSACAGGQSTAQACTILEKSPITTGDGFDKSLEDAVQNGGTINEAFAPISDELKKLTKDITNDELAPTVKEANDALTSLLKTAGDMNFPAMADMDMTDPEAMAELEEIQANFEKLEAEVTPASEKLNTAFTKINEVCSK